MPLGRSTLATIAISGTMLFASAVIGCSAAPADERPSAAEAVALAESSPGWSALAPEQRRRLEALVEGRANPWSAGAREALRDLVVSAPFTSAPAAAQAELLEGLWRDARVRPRSIATLGLASRTVRARYTLRAPVPLGMVELDGVPEPSVRHALVVDGREVAIDASVLPPREGTQLAPEDVARAVARLPCDARAELDALELVPFRNPRDDAYARDFGMPGFRTFMEGRSTGTVLVFPRVEATIDPADMLLHEVAHVWSLRDLDDDAWRAWEQAEAEDAHDASVYAATHPREDLAETAAARSALAGQPGEAEVRAMFPSRFALLDAWAPRNACAPAQ